MGKELYDEKNWGILDYPAWEVYLLTPPSSERNHA